jgi:hypothetical protein
VWELRFEFGCIDTEHTEEVFVSPERFDNALTGYLWGTRLQSSQTGAGVPLQPSGAMSYIDFGDGTNAEGVEDRVFDVPVVQRPLGDLAMSTTSQASSTTTASRPSSKMGPSASISPSRSAIRP